jgi:HSP20 family protein
MAARPDLRNGLLEMLREEMEDLVARFRGEGSESWSSRLPQLDIAETDQHIEVAIDVPGIDPNEVDLRIQGDVLTVRGEYRQEEKEAGKTFHRVERRRGGFVRTVTLPMAVDEKGVKATYRDGVLTVTLPKPQDQRSRRIKIEP